MKATSSPLMRLSFSQCLARLDRYFDYSCSHPPTSSAVFGEPFIKKQNSNTKDVCAVGGWEQLRLHFDYQSREHIRLICFSLLSSPQTRPPRTYPLSETLRQKGVLFLGPSGRMVVNHFPIEPSFLGAAFRGCVG